MPIEDTKSLEDMIARRRDPKKELADERLELVKLLAQLPPTHKDVQALKEKISKNHDELMEILKNEESLSREFGKKRF
ncbi:MAG TPA: hypothetical protein VLF94_03645 [Chlamydiales bacterium]|nr:hypothetical protein [Chlamydiales bacterium]